MIDPLEETQLAEENEQEYYEHHHIVVDKGQGLLRIDRFLVDRLMNASRNKIQAAAHAGTIQVNGKEVKPNYKVKPLDEISIVMSYPPREYEITPENIPLDIVYEDADVLLVNKTPEMVVHPGFGNFTGTLVHALAYYFQQNDPKAQPCLVHRIDKNTSGLLLVAKNEIAQTYLAKQFYDHSVQRRYLALVWGDFAEDKGTIEGAIGRSLKDRKVMAVFPDGSYGKEAITHYEVLERFGYVTLVACVLETGRTHQIRAHMRYIKHPLFNDATYGGDQILKGTTFTKYKQYIHNCFSLLPRQALHAATLGFVHPSTKKPMFFEAPLPGDMGAVIDKWRQYVQFNEAPEEAPDLSEMIR